MEGTLTYNCMGSFHLDRHDGGNVKQAEANGPLLGADSNLGAPTLVPRLCTLPPGNLERFPVGRPVGKA